MLRCNGGDRGSSFALTRKGADFTHIIQAGSIVDAWFELDLVEAGLLTLVAEGESILYVVSGPHVSEPWRVNANPE